MMVGQLRHRDLADRMAGEGLAVRTGPFNLRIHCDVDSVHRGVHLLYQQHPLAEPDAWDDYVVHVQRPSGLRRWLRPQVQFSFDGARVFEPLPLAHALPLTEWALNWAIATRAHQYLILHAAVVARDDRAVVLPAPPGSGKSTLCAALIHRGWRLLSDELALIDLTDAGLWPLVRPVSLKNASIDVLKAFAPEAVFSERTEDTRKGTVALVRPPAAQVDQASRPARAAWVVLPRYEPDAPARLVRRLRPGTLVELSRNAFNLGAAGREGFHALGRLLDGCRCYDFSYGRLDDAMQVFDDLVDGSEARWVTA